MENDNAIRPSDRRTSFRHNVQIDVDYRMGESYLFSRAENLSELGIFLASDEPFDVQTRIDLRFRAPEGDDPLEIKGEVIWVEIGASGKTPGMGIRFFDLDLAQKERIKSLIRTIAYLDD